MYLRRLLAETPVFEELKARRALAAETPLKAVLRDYRGAVVLSGLLTWMLSAAIVVVILMTPALLEKMYGVAAVVVLRANSLAALGLTAGCVLAGRLTDRFGPGRVLLVGCPLLGAAAYLLYAAATLDPWLTTFLYTLAGLTTGIVAVVPYVMIAMFPPKIRFSGISFSYNVAYAIFGGLTPMLWHGCSASIVWRRRIMSELSACWARQSESFSLYKVLRTSSKDDQLCDGRSGQRLRQLGQEPAGLSKRAVYCSSFHEQGESYCRSYL